MSNFKLIEGNGVNSIDNVVAFNPDAEEPVFQADSKHPHFQAIVSGLRNDDPNVWDLFDVQGGLKKRLTTLSERISYDGENILFDGDVHTGPLATHLKRCLEAGVQNYEAVVKFWEKVAQNPDDRSREQLFTWLQSHDFTITEDGDILGYKGVNGHSEETFRSISSGTAFVDGKEVSGYIPNRPGSVVTMPRNKVANDPSVACHYGLHVGDWSYAHNFAQGAVLEVHVNPRDVVSIPSDSSQRKMRCCRYRVVKVRDAKSNLPIENPDDTRWEGDVGYKVERSTRCFY